MTYEAICEKYGFDVMKEYEKTLHDTEYDGPSSFHDQFTEEEKNFLYNYILKL